MTTATGRRRWLSGDFGRFWLGQTISNLGSSFTFFALPLLVFDLTGSPLSLGITVAVEFVPYLLFGLVIGAWVDRVDRKRLMIATDLARAAVIATIPLLAAVDTLTVGWIEGFEFSLFGGVVGLDIRRPAIKLPGLGRIGMSTFSV